MCIYYKLKLSVKLKEKNKLITWKYKQNYQIPLTLSAKKVFLITSYISNNLIFFNIYKLKMLINLPYSTHSTTLKKKTYKHFTTL